MRQNRFGKAMPLLAALLLSGPLSASQALKPDASLEREVSAAIRNTPRYGPFDLITYEVSGHTVTLGGDVYRGVLKQDAEAAVEAVPGVTRVVDSIKVLPVSFNDDRLRREVFVRIYHDNFLSKYGPPYAMMGPGAWERWHASWALGPDLALGLEPIGNYAIHVVVDHGQVTLYGNVDNAVDRDKASFDARTVLGVRDVVNRIQVRGAGAAA